MKKVRDHPPRMVFQPCQANSRTSVGALDRIVDNKIRAENDLLRRMSKLVTEGQPIPTLRGRRLPAPLQARQISEARMVEPHVLCICFSMNTSRSHHKCNLGLVFSFWHNQTQESIKNPIVSTTPYGQLARYVPQTRRSRKKIPSGWKGRNVSIKSIGLRVAHYHYIRKPTSIHQRLRLLNSRRESAGKMGGPSRSWIQEAGRRR